MTGRVSRLSFYDGNDLRAIPPPADVTADPSGVQVRAHEGSGKALWYQLKATDKPWTMGALLEKNLLLNFLLNALESREAGQEFEVHLVTQAEFHPSTVDAFLQNPSTAPGHQARLDHIIDRTRQEWSRHRPSFTAPESDELKVLAMDIIGKLRNTTPVPLEVLQQEVVAALRSEYYDEQLAEEIAFSARGALLHDASVRPALDGSQVQQYDADWLYGVTRIRRKAVGLVLEDPPQACEQATERAVPDGWNAAICAPRPSVDHALDTFMASDRDVFVLLGTSGGGKSWAVSDWCLRTLKGSMRLLVRWPDVVRTPDLAYLLESTVGPLSDRGWQPHAFVDWFVSEANARGGSSPVLVVDDILTWAESPIKVRQIIGHLVQQCRSRGIKLLLTCQAQVWITHDIGSALPLDALFLGTDDRPELTRQADGDSSSDQPSSELLTLSRSEEARRTARRYSMVLDELSESDIRAILVRRMPAHEATELALSLRDSRYAAFRNPYLLVLYLAHLMRTDQPPSVTIVDDLLDERFRDLLAPLARDLAWEIPDVEAALSALWERLWTSRQVGLTSLDAARTLDGIFSSFPGEAVLSALRQSGLLSVSSPIAIVEPLVADRMFARRLIEKHGPSSHVSIASELRLESDVSTVLALLRGEINHPAQLGQHLLSNERAWGPAVKAGLAQGSTNDYESLALLSALTHPQPPSLVDPDACDALGRLAVRGVVAQDWVAKMYLSDRPLDRTRGEQALKAAMRLGPSTVTQVVRQRLSRGIEMPAFQIADQERQRKWLDGALDPVLSVADELGVREVQAILNEIPPEIAAQPSLQHDIREVRAAALLETTGAGIDDVLVQLRSADTKQRVEAADMLRVIVPDRPELVRQAIVQSIRQEDNPEVLIRITWACYRIMDVAADELMSALESREWFDSAEPSPCASLVLALAGDLASRMPVRVEKFLPQSVACYEPARRSLMAETFAYAWWKCAQYRVSGSHVLSDFLNQRLDDVPDEWRVLVMQAAVVAQLGLDCLERGIAPEIEGLHSPYPRNVLMGMHVPIHKVVSRNAASLAASAELEHRLMECFLQERRPTVASPWNWLGQANFLCADHCARMLVDMKCAGADPGKVITQFTDDELALRAARKLLDDGHRGHELLSVTATLCNRTENPPNFQIAYERSRCIGHLAASSDDPSATLPGFMDAVSRQFGPDHRAIVLTPALDSHTEIALHLLEDTIRRPDDVPPLYLLEEYSRSWPVHLIGRVHARMLDPTPISVDEASALCDQMICALRVLPSSPLQAEYEGVYAAIAARLRQAVRRVLPLITREGAFPRSHELAREILEEVDVGNEGANENWLRDKIADSRGWWESFRYSLADGTFSERSGYLVFPFPAVRLAAVAAGTELTLTDPATEWTAEMTSVHDAIKAAVRSLEYGGDSDEEMEKSTGTLIELVTRWPRSARVRLSLGDLLVRRHCIDDAKEYLLECVSMRSSSEDVAASAWYDLACAYGLAGEETNCREALTASDAIHPVDRQHLSQDDDFAAFRNTQWFEEFLGTGKHTEGRES